MTARESGSGQQLAGLVVGYGAVASDLNFAIGVETAS
jgi:hypothetical protein